MEKIMLNFSKLLNQSSDDLISVIMKFYFSLFEIEKEKLLGEIQKILPGEISGGRVPKEVIAFLFPRAKNIQELKSKGLDQNELDKFFSTYFEDIKKKTFLNSLQNPKINCKY